jgi:TPR repeat protein
VSILALLAVSSTGLSLWFYVDATRQKEIAEQQKQIAEQRKEQADDILNRAIKIIQNEAGRMQVETTQEVFAILTAGARHGDARATGFLGWAYLFGFGVAQDRAKAIELYEKAAAKDDAWAMYNLAIFYQAQDLTKAREFYEKAAAKGDESAMVDLGMLFANGQDYAKAREWWEKAAAKGHARAPWLTSA